MTPKTKDIFMKANSWAHSTCTLRRLSFKGKTIMDSSVRISRERHLLIIKGNKRDKYLEFLFLTRRLFTEYSARILRSSSTKNIIWTPL